MKLRTALSALFWVAALTGCKQETSGPAPSSKPSALPAPVASGLPGDPSRVSGVVNPNKEKAYEGPTATVHGRVRGSGDAASASPVRLSGVPAECAKARDVYGYPFQEGPQRELADVLVTVTGYQGYVPEKNPALALEASDCTWGTRTIALTYGQRIEVVSADKNSYVPELLGSQMKSQLVATPFGKGTASLYPPAAGRYVLIDNLRLFMTAEVLVLKYATHDVTGADGSFEIAGIPPGKVTVSAFLPSTGAVEQKEIELKGGDSKELDFTLAFDAKKFEAALKAAGSASASPSSSAPPAASH
jgi:hypothetical protein